MINRPLIIQLLAACAAGVDALDGPHLLSTAAFELSESNPDLARALRRKARLERAAIVAARLALDEDDTQTQGEQHGND